MPGVEQDVSSIQSEVRVVPRNIFPQCPASYETGASRSPVVPCRKLPRFTGEALLDCIGDGGDWISTLRYNLTTRLFCENLHA